MNQKAVLLLLAISAAATNALPAAASSPLLSSRPVNLISRERIEIRPEASLCPTCLKLGEAAINQLLNIILNSGVVAGCGDLCGILANETGNPTLGAVCTMACDIAGFEAFTKIIQQADFDPIYYCQILKICSIKDNADANITVANIVPSSGPKGTMFVLMVNYTSVNGTGPGETQVDIMTVDGVPVGSGFFQDAMVSGNYTVKVNVNTTQDPNCDPTTDICEEWLPGAYTANFAVCNGECGSKHPHSKILGSTKVSFTITG